MLTGIPQPTIEWYIDEDVIPLDDEYYEMTFCEGRAKLFMKTVDVHDEGEYMVVATNEYGSASSSCELTVIGNLVIVLVDCSTYSDDKKLLFVK